MSEIKLRMATTDKEGSSASVHAVNSGMTWLAKQCASKTRSPVRIGAIWGSSSVDRATGRRCTLGVSRVREFESCLLHQFSGTGLRLKPGIVLRKGE